MSLPIRRHGHADSLIISYRRTGFSQDRAESGRPSVTMAARFGGSDYLASARLGSFHPGRGKWQV